MTETPTLTLDLLREAVRSDAAIRSITELQPAGGPGDKVFPPTYEGGKYALEQRVIDGQRVPCVLLDSVASQANRMELALLRASPELKLPVIRVKFGGKLADIGEVTSLDAPHRLADAILRDSVAGNKPFRETEAGKCLETASSRNASQVFRWCPSALVFGLWDSTGPRGGLGAKFARCLVSEIVGVDIEPGTKTESRIDPLGIQLAAGPIFEGKDGGWTLDPAKAAKEKNGPKKLGKDGKPSEANHGNVMPTITENAGGVTLSRAVQVAVLSLAGLRRLSFPVGDAPSQHDEAARVALAALGLAGLVLAQRDGFDLRSRCALVPTRRPILEILGAYGDRRECVLAPTEAIELVKQASHALANTDLRWRSEGLTLAPSADFAQLIEKSRLLASGGSAE
jgi:CRISPR-associated protein Csb1